ncbi:hypothetical protein Hanom_Chr16g01483941 [Helianthus anomalus]
MQIYSIRANRLIFDVFRFSFDYFTCFNQFFEYQASMCIVKSRIMHNMAFKNVNYVKSLHISLT